MDALATPLVGIMSDKWGSRKTWHLAGERSTPTSAVKNLPENWLKVRSFSSSALSDRCSNFMVYNKLLS